MKVPHVHLNLDYYIHIQDSTETFQDKETLKSTCIELIKSGQVDPTMIFNIMTAKTANKKKRKFFTISKAQLLRNKPKNKIKNRENRAKNRAYKRANAAKIKRYQKSRQNLIDKGLHHVKLRRKA